MNDLRSYVDGEAELELLARARETTLGQLIDRVVKAKAAERIADIRKRPKIDTVNIPEDVKYKFGFADGVEWLSGLFDQAEKERMKGDGT